MAESLRAAAALGDSIVFLCPRRARSFRRSFEDLERKLKSQDKPVHMLIDGASGAGFLAGLPAQGIEITPLFPADVDADLFSVAPRLVTFSDPATVLEQFQGFWACGMACILISAMDTEALVQHLKQNLYIEDPDGEICVLRFHDPRVLARLADTLDQDQIAQLFGTAIDMLIFEGSAGEVRLWTQSAGDAG